LEDTLTQRSKLVESSKTLVLRSVPQGVVVENLFIEDVIVPPETMRALSSAARQRRTSEANIINSKADVESASLLK
jgi:regulator of protease activity HflC (stomatin/prohibitin superfamily)